MICNCKEDNESDALRESGPNAIQVPRDSTDIITEEVCRQDGPVLWYAMIEGALSARRTGEPMTQ